MTIYKKILEKIPQILNSGENPEHCFENTLNFLKEAVEFEAAYVCYLNSGNAGIKYRKTAEKEEIFTEKTTILPVDESAKPDLYSPEPLLFSRDSAISKSFGIKKNKNFLLSKLLINETVFGFILLSRTKTFTNTDIQAAKAFCALASYSIKDSELSDVFKMQLKELQESIIDRAQAHATIKEQNEKILEADKVKSEFLANTSHELRTPLNAIIGFSEVLSRQLFGPLNEKQAEYIRDIHVSGLHLLGMINEILEISKLESRALKLTPSNFSLNMSVTEVVNVIQPLADKKMIHLVKKMPEEIGIRADYQKIQQIMYNLLSNAIKFTPANGHIEIEIKKLKNQVEIYVKDDGIGIAPEYQEKIFSKFVQLNNIYCKNESSTGLGLTITRELTLLHGGTISVKSKPERGSTFTVKLPLRLA